MELENKKPPLFILKESGSLLIYYLPFKEKSIAFL
jgi:hypothetical protein